MARQKNIPGALDGVDLNKLTPGKHNDQPGRGFYIDVQRSGSASWVYQYMFDGKVVFFTYGSVKKMLDAAGKPDIQAARRWHAEQFNIRAAGRCPKTEYLKANAEAGIGTKAGITFKAAAAAYIADSQDAKTWRPGSRSEDNFVKSLDNHVYPKIGDKLMIKLTEGDILDVLRPIWHKKKTLGEQVRQRICSVFRHCFANNKDIRKVWEGLNPADKDHVVSALKPRADYEVRHHPSMPYQRLPAFMAKLREREATGAKALEMTILSTLRVNSVAEGKWTELPKDWRAHKIWVIPGERMKSGKPFTLTLTPRMIEILEEMEPQREDGNPHIFPGRNVGASLCDQTLLQFLQESMREPDCTVHGFRSSFRNWAFEQGRDNDGLRFIREIPELTLSHKIGDETELSYLTAEGRDLKREILTAWGDYCDASDAPVVRGNVVRLKRKAG